MFTTRLDTERWQGELEDEGFRIWDCIQHDHEPWIQLSVLPSLDDLYPTISLMSVSEFARLCAADNSKKSSFATVGLATSPHMNQRDSWKIDLLQELSEWNSMDGVFRWFRCRTTRGVYDVAFEGELMVSTPRPTMPPKILYTKP